MHHGLRGMEAPGPIDEATTAHFTTYVSILQLHTLWSTAR